MKKLNRAEIGRALDLYASRLAKLQTATGGEERAAAFKLGVTQALVGWLMEGDEERNQFLAVMLKELEEEK